MGEREDAAEVSLCVKNEQDVSPECLAWADSCIVSFPDDSESNSWATLRDALTEIIDIRPEIFVASSTGTATVLSPDEDMTETDSSDLRRFDSANSDNNNTSREEVSEILSLLTFESDPSKNSLQDDYFPDNGTSREPVLDNQTRDHEGVESIEEDGSLSNGEEAEEEEEEEEEAEAEAFLSQVFKDDFMSAYIQDGADEFNVSEDLLKATPQEIFKVWDLEIVDDDGEEDGLVLQLKNALDESSRVQPLNDDDRVVARKSGIDDLIAGISDMSLTETYPSER